MPAGRPCSASEPGAIAAVIDTSQCRVRMSIELKRDILTGPWSGYDAPARRTQGQVPRGAP